MIRFVPFLGMTVLKDEVALYALINTYPPTKTQASLSREGSINTTSRWEDYEFSYLTRVEMQPSSEKYIVTHKSSLLCNTKGLGNYYIDPLSTEFHTSGHKHILGQEAWKEM